MAIMAILVPYIFIFLPKCGVTSGIFNQLKLSIDILCRPTRDCAHLLDLQGVASQKIHGSKNTQIRQ